MGKRRLAKALGLSRQEAERLLARARGGVGNRGLLLRRLAYALGVNPILGRLLPRRIREAAIRPLVYALIPGPTENLLYARVTTLPGGAEEVSDC